MLDRTGDRATALRLPALLLGADVPVPPETRATSLLRILDLFGLDGRALGHQPALALHNDRIYALLPTRPAGTVPATALIAHLHGRALRTLHIGVTIVSDEVATRAGLDRARQDIDTALDHLRGTGAAPGHHTTGELRAELVRKRLLDTVRDDSLLRTGLGERVVAHDRSTTPTSQPPWRSNSGPPRRRQPTCGARPFRTPDEPPGFRTVNKPRSSRRGPSLPFGS